MTDGTNQEQLERMKHLLMTLQQSGLDTSKRKRTFMEIAGIESREISISKILSFLLDTEAEHGMGDLWLRSLVQAAMRPSAAFDPEGMRLSPSECRTEVVTNNIEQNLRIDIVVESPELILGIENKIGATLYNNLESYAGQIADMANGREALLLTLSLNDESAATAAWESRCERHGVTVRNVTYISLFEQIRTNSDGGCPKADNEWAVFVRDFMKTIESQGEQKMQFDDELFTFMAGNMPDIILMKNKMEEATRATREQAARLQEMLLADGDLAAASVGKPSIYSPDRCYMWCSTYYRIPVEGKKGTVHPEITNNIESIDVRCWVSSSAAKIAARHAIAAAGIPIVEDLPEHLVIAKLPLETPEEDLVAHLKMLVIALLPIRNS